MRKKLVQDDANGPDLSGSKDVIGAERGRLEAQT